MDRFKMSKSRGNVANPFEAMKLWGVDAMRMYLMRVGGNSAGDAGTCTGVIGPFPPLTPALGTIYHQSPDTALLL